MDATRWRWRASTRTQPVVKWALDTYGVLPYCWPHWVEFHAADAVRR